MKKSAVGLAFLIVFTACGGGEKPANAKEPVSMVGETIDLSENPDYKKGLALVGQNDCLTCHKVNEASTGPAYADVAARYANATDTTITRLANTIIKGSSGKWGPVPMTPHPALSVDDATALVKYVLLLKK